MDMMALLFFLYLITMLFALKGKRTLSCYSFIMSLIVSLFWFSHHATDTLMILL
ncbi:DUF5993 family protein [Shewanella sp. VB17]|uniref:DUF5993 family protein n=1 Tax=Shewanella sp. VB17 TaxID=2739432 RepID=UPI002814D2E3|nr:DUF5993 family protein [Shewanella sp. VB17]